MNDVLVLSDLHLGRGRNPRTGRFYALEAFFYDDDLRGFLQHACRLAREERRPFTLVLNGDTFDLLRIDENARKSDPADDPQLSREHKKLTWTPRAAAATVREILAGHPAFVDGLAQVLLDGNHVVILPGNHDIEVQWPVVQDEIARAVLGRVEAQQGAEAAAAARARLSIKPWFHHEPGRLWIEHGSQYDPENSFRNLLRTDLDPDSPSVTELDRDLPLGSFFQRYLYNTFGALTFIVPSSRAHLRYTKWLLLNKPRTLFKNLVRHGPFFFQILRRVARSAVSVDGLRALHEASLSRLAADSGLGDKLRVIDGLKRVRPDVAQAAAEAMNGLVRLVRFLALIGLLALGVWFAAFWTINRLHIAIGLPLFLVLNLALLIFAFAVVWAVLRSPPAPALRPLREAAATIAELVDVPVVTFGHTHEESTRPLGEGRWYFNTGTWIAVFTHDEMLPRERVQFTYLRVRDDNAELMFWSPGRGQSLPVILLDDESTALAAPA